MIEIHDSINIFFVLLFLYLIHQYLQDFFRVSIFQGYYCHKYDEKDLFHIKTTFHISYPKKIID